MFLPGLIAGNTVFVGGHFILGFVIGAPALALIAGAGGAVAGIVAFVALAAAGVAGWRVLRRRRAGMAPARGQGRNLPSVGAWTEAACPACLAVAALTARGEAAPMGSA